MEMQEMRQRPLCLELENAKNDIYAAFNKQVSERKIPFFLLENIVNEVAHKVSAAADAERAAARKSLETKSENPVDEMTGGAEHANH